MLNSSIAHLSIALLYVVCGSFLVAGEVGDFESLPPQWARENTDAGYILPHDVAENMHYDQPFRPQFHFTVLHSHIGDATGLVTYKGRYHLFFVFDPWQRSRRWHKCCGHANLGGVFAGTPRVYD
jgi:hypothetical protein